MNDSVTTDNSLMADDSSTTQPLSEGAQTPARGLAPLAWRWPWYMIALVAAIVTGNGSSGFRGYGLLVFTVLAVLVMLVERTPEVVVIPAVLAAWIVWQAQWDVWQQVVGYSLVCVLVFTSQFIWNKKVISPIERWLPAQTLPQVVGLGGQVFVVLIVLKYGGPFAQKAVLQHVGAVLLLVLALLLVWFAHVQYKKEVERRYNYGAGLLVAMVISWEVFVVFHPQGDIVTLPPASYLSVVAPFLMGDKTISGYQRVGRIVAIVGAISLLLPTLVLSVYNNPSQQLVSTLLLLGESLGLFFLGIATNVGFKLGGASLADVRIFRLGGASLVVVGAVLALIYAVNQDNPNTNLVWVALVISGISLLAGGTILAFRRRQEEN